MSGKSKGKKGGKGKLKVLLLLVLIALAVAWYQKQDESKKRYLKHLGKQLPYLPARYYA